jgi:hypothetical protein
VWSCRENASVTKFISEDIGVVWCKVCRSYVFCGNVFRIETS